jgi:hypothetical protein
VEAEDPEELPLPPLLPPLPPLHPEELLVLLEPKPPPPPPPPPAPAEPPPVTAAMVICPVTSQWSIRSVMLRVLGRATIPAIPSLCASSLDISMHFFGTVQEPQYTSNGCTFPVSKSGNGERSFRASAHASPWMTRPYRSHQFVEIWQSPPAYMASASTRSCKHMSASVHGGKHKCLGGAHRLGYIVEQGLRHASDVRRRDDEQENNRHEDGDC